MLMEWHPKSQEIFNNKLPSLHFLRYFLLVDMTLFCLLSSMPFLSSSISLQVGNLGLLFMLLFFIYAALGVELFGDQSKHTSLSPFTFLPLCFTFHLETISIV